MGLFKKISRGGKNYYKVYSKCQTEEHGKILLVSSKEKDLDKKIKDKNADILKSIFGDEYCEKCTINVDLLGDDANIKKAKKIYQFIEI